jgi:hypothetical protein
MVSTDVNSWDIEMDQIDATEAKEFITNESPDIRVNNVSIAQMIGEVLRLPFSIPLTRSFIELQPDDEALVASYHGPPIRPGSADVDPARLKFWKVSLHAA